MPESQSPQEEVRFQDVWPGMAPCRRCGAPVRQDVEVCPACGKWQHGMQFVLAALGAIAVSLVVAWFVFTNTF